MKSFNSKLFCEELLNLRDKESISQTKLSEKLGINRTTLSFLETGKQLPSLELLNKICGLLNKNPGDFFVETNNDGLIYLMGSLKERDKEKISLMMERIRTREKYEVLVRRCLHDFNR